MYICAKNNVYLEEYKLTKEKVLLVHNFYQINGGEHTVYANEKKLLEENGHSVVCYTRDNSELKSSFLKKLLLPLTTIFSFKTYFEVKKVLKNEQIDIVHCHNTFPLISPSVYYAAKSCKVPVVQTIHNFRFLCPNALFYREGEVCEECLTKGVFNAVKYGCYRNSKIQTLVVSAMLFVHRLLGTYKSINYIFLTEFNKEKFRCLLGDYVDKQFVKPNFEYIDEQPAKSEEIDHNKFVFIGRLDENKGVRFLLDAWKNVDKEKQLYIYGDGKLADMVKMAAENNSNIHFMGFQPISTVLQSLKTSEAMVFTSELYETFGLTVIESFSVGVPVLCSDIGNAADLVNIADAGITYKTKDIDDFISKLHKISLNRNNFSQNAINEYKTKYSSRENYKQLKIIYEKVQKNKCQ